MNRVLSALMKFALPLLIIGGAVFVAVLLATSGSEPQRNDRGPDAVLVEVMEITAGQHRINVQGTGTIESKNTHSLIPQVGGPVVDQAPDLQDGTSYKQGDMLFQIERNEYEFRVAEARAALATAEFNLKEEEGRQLVAQREWKLLDQRLKQAGITRELALREAHLEERKMAVEGAQKTLALAELNLARTTITAPCDGIVLNENISIGQVLSAGQSAGTFACTDIYQIITSIPQDDVQWVRGDASTATTQAGNNGVVKRLLADVDETSRMAKLLVEIDNPLAQTPQPLIGQFVTVTIPGRQLNDLYAVPNNALQEGNLLWLATDNNRLEFVQVELVKRQAGQALIRLSDQENETIRIVTSRLTAPYDGMGIRLANNNQDAQNE